MAYSKAKLKSSGTKAFQTILNRKYIKQIFTCGDFTVGPFKHILISLTTPRTLS